mmetsp:Transcript_4236/g.13551  ORF Transcript_4236/g.13551 Transcript_4236/m.13551 type:complete len:246 (-) Transcript_4236:52-789(-)
MSSSSTSSSAAASSSTRRSATPAETAASAAALAALRASARCFFFFWTILRRKNSSRSSSSSSELMKAMVPCVFGITTFSSAFTRRFVTLIASSSTTHVVCSAAIFTRRLSVPRNFLRAALISSPPRPRPLTMDCTDVSSSSPFMPGMATPAMLLARSVALYGSILSDSCTEKEMSPATYCASVTAKCESRISRGTSSLASRSSRMILRWVIMSASAFFLSSEWPFVAPLRRVLKAIRLMRLGRAG